MRTDQQQGLEVADGVQGLMMEQQSVGAVREAPRYLTAAERK